MTNVKLIAELIAKYNAFRAKWVEIYGSPAGFDEWFTKQVAGV